MIRNIHDRDLPAPTAAVGALIDSLAGPDDRLWPSERWPPMGFDRPLGVGATGGHGPVGYVVEEYRPGALIRFRFHAPAGFDGHHGYEVLPGAGGGCRLRHSLVMRAHGPARITWPLVYRPLHDALIEDSLDTATRSLGLPLAVPARWSPAVRALRAAAGARRTPGRRRLPVTRA